MARLFSWPYRIAQRFGWRSLTAGIDLMTPQERRRTIAVSVFIAASKLFEMGALASVMPVVSLIVQPDLLHTSDLAQHVYNAVGAPEPATFIILLAVIAGVLILLGNVTEFLVLQVILFFTARCENRLSRDLMHETATASYSWFTQQNSVSLTRIFQTEINVWGQLFLRNLLTIFNNTLTILVGIALILALAALKALLALLVIGILSAALLAVIRPMALKWSNRNKTAHAEAVLASSNILAGAKEFKFAPDQQHMIDAFDSRYADRTGSAARMQMWGNVPARLMMAVGQTGLLVIALALWLTGGTSAEIVSQMAVLLLVTSRVIPAITQMFGTMNGLWRALPWIERLHEMRHSIRRSKSADRHHERVGVPPTDWQKITVRNMSFGYDESRGRVLDNVSFYLEYGRQYGLVGPSGSGKSSLVDLLSGLLRPDSGTIIVDGVDLNTLAGSAWRRQVGYVSQSPYFADDTVRRNIAYGVATDDIDDQLVWHCLSMTLMEDVVRHLPNGLDTRLGESSVQLSGGQRQRLAIARALYKRPRLLILDEATSALDSASEERVLAAIDSLRGKLTVLSISHRASAVANCDKTFELAAGHLRERTPNDTPETVIQASG